MNDYSDIGLNDRLQAVNGLSEREQPGIERTYFPAPSIENPPGVISGTAGTAIVDGRGIVSLFNFVNSNTATNALNQSITGTTATDITNSSHSFVLQRPALVYFPFSVHMYLVETGTTNCDGRAYLNINGTVQPNTSRVAVNTGGTNLQTFSNYVITQLAAGTHTIKLQAHLTRIEGTASLTIEGYRHSYIIFGK
jgi:hypothetical protein